MLVGYMRVSSDNDRQTTALQHDALISAGVDARHLSRTRRRVRATIAPASRDASTS